MDNSETIKTLEQTGSAPKDPLKLFQDWLTEAEETEPNDPNAMCLATVGPNGMPSTRIMLLKGLDDRGFVFYTNKESRKGVALAANPVASLCFYWKGLAKQIRVEGTIEHVSDEEADIYYASRPRGSRIGAWASQQSRPLKSRDALTARIEKYEQEYEGQEDIPRPPYWGGYRLKPNMIEFWHAGGFRLHTRFVYTKKDDSEENNGDWEKEMLFP